MAREIILRTNLTPEEAVGKLGSSVSPWPEWWQVFVNWHPFDEPEDEYIGTMNGKSFTISILWHSHGFRRGPSLIRLKGQVLSDSAGDGSLIHLRAAEIWWMYPILAIWWLVVFIGVTRESAGQSDRLHGQAIVGLVGVAWVVLALFFRSFYKDDDEMMIGFLEKNLEAREVEKPTESSGIARG